jgi:hypothetical protein
VTIGWPDDAEIRRVIAAWGQLLDEELMAVPGGDPPLLDWPDDTLIAQALVEWGAVADQAIDAAAALDPVFDPTMAWLDGSGVDTAVEPPSLPMAGADGLRPGGSRGTRKHKVARPGGPIRTTGWTERPAPGQGRVSVPDRWNQMHRWAQVALVAAAAAAVLVIGITPNQRHGGPTQPVSVGSPAGRGSPPRSDSSGPTLGAAGSGGGSVGAGTQPGFGFAQATPVAGSGGPTGSGPGSLRTGSVGAGTTSMSGTGRTGRGVATGAAGGASPSGSAPEVSTPAPSSCPITAPAATASSSTTPTSVFATSAATTTSTTVPATSAGRTASPTATPVSSSPKSGTGPSGQPATPTSTPTSTSPTTTC